MNHEGFTKLIPRLVRSSIWFEPDYVLRVWIYMLATVNRHGIVESSILGLSHGARVTREQAEFAVEKLKSPDPDSTTKTNDGRRIDDAKNGWLIINFKEIRDTTVSADRREYKRVWAANNKKNPSNTIRHHSTKSPNSTQAEAEAEA